ncbi:MAG: carbohydrate kinase family protein [Candidatus Bipolaricaulota bacterium]|nr:carbohydrate kinase family protein [Candidatus Bipolaricaulota bacterium]
MRAFDIVGFGALNLDELYRVERILDDDEGEVVFAGAYPGGSAANTVYALAQLGLRAGFLGVVGDDDAGRIILESFRNVGVDTSGIVIKPKAKTGRALGFIDSRGRRTLYIEPGANSLLRKAEIDFSYVARAQFVHLSSFVGEEQWAIQCELVRALSPKTLVSFAPGALLARRGVRALSPVLQRTHVLFLNRRELEMLVHTGDPGIGTRTLLKSGPCIVAVTLGAEGSYITDGKRAYRVEAPRVRKIVDTTGAGDAFAAGFLYGLFEERELRECAELGAQLAKLAVGQMGGRLNAAISRLRQ